MPIKTAIALVTHVELCETHAHHQAGLEPLSVAQIDSLVTVAKLPELAHLTTERH